MLTFILLEVVCLEELEAPWWLEELEVFFIDWTLEALEAFWMRAFAVIVCTVQLHAWDTSCVDIHLLNAHSQKQPQQPQQPGSDRLVTLFFVRVACDGSKLWLRGEYEQIGTFPQAPFQRQH